MLKVLSSNEAAAQAAKLARINVAAVYPITWAGAAVCFIALFSLLITRKIRQEPLDGAESA